MDKREFLLDLYEIELYKKSLYEDGIGTNQPSAFIILRTSSSKISSNKKGMCLKGVENSANLIIRLFTSNLSNASPHAGHFKVDSLTGFPQFIHLNIL